MCHVIISAKIILIIKLAENDVYIKRHAETTLGKLLNMFGAVLVTGPRQVGKTTMLKHITNISNHVSLDDPLIRAGAINQATTFFKDYPPPLFIDEIQYAPNLFSQMKIVLDQSKKKGQFIMTGSQQFELMRNVSESLAGRLGLLTLLGFSLRERLEIPFSDFFLPTNEYLNSRQDYLKELLYQDTWKMIHLGSMPELVIHQDYSWQMFFSSYVKTYLERDVHQLTQVRDELQFANFMTAVASRTGNLLNLASLARDVAVSQPTAERWLSILVASGIVYLLKPFHNNILKRAVRTPKIYFLDTGLAAYLTRWSSPDVLKEGAMSGAFFETFVISEIIKSFYNQGVLNPPLYFYRDRDGKEIDLLIENNGIMHPLEIKKHADPQRSDVSVFRLLDTIPNFKRGCGGIICFCDHVVSLSETDKVIPINYL